MMAGGKGNFETFFGGGFPAGGIAAVCREIETSKSRNIEKSKAEGAVFENSRRLLAFAGVLSGGAVAVGWVGGV